MGALIQFIILLIKIALLASFYATINWFWIFFLSKLYPNWRCAKWMNKKIASWFVLGFSWSVLLFCYSFSYWGYAGLGTRKRIPVGYGQEMIQTELMIEEESPECEKWKQQGHFIVGVLRKFETTDNDIYIVWDLKLNELQEFKSKEAYLKVVTSLKVKQPLTYKSFQEHYSAYWWGWRLIFLP